MEAVARAATRAYVIIMEAVARAASRAIVAAMKRAGKAAEKAGAETAKDVMDTAHELWELWKSRQIPRGLPQTNGRVDLPPVVGDKAELPDPKEAPLLDTKNLIKILEALLAGGALYAVHVKDVAARHPRAQETEGLKLVFSMPPPSATVLNTRAIVPRAAALAAIILVQDVSPGIIGFPGNVNFELPPVAPGPISSDRFDPAGFLLVILVPILFKMFED